MWPAAVGPCSGSSWISVVSVLPPPPHFALGWATRVHGSAAAIGSHCSSKAASVFPNTARGV